MTAKPRIDRGGRCRSGARRSARLALRRAGIPTRAALANASEERFIAFSLWRDADEGVA